MSIPSPDAVLHLAALHTLAAAGFASTSRAASLTLSSTLAQYLRVVATACTDRAVLAGRSKVAAIDVIQALEDLSVGNVVDLQEWTVGLEQEVTFRDAGLSGLEEVVREGVGESQALVEMRLARGEEVQELNDKEDAEEDEEDYENDEDEVVKSEPGYKFSLPSPDMSWLPDLPGVTPTIVPIAEHAHAPSSLPTSDLSIPERYRKRIPFSHSTLSTSREFTDPPADYPMREPKVPPTSFPALAEAYKVVGGEASVSLRQTHYRQQASEVLRRFVAPADAFSPADTLVSPLPAPRVTPIIPSHSDTLAPHFIPINPDPHAGLLSSLLHRMQSPHLPPTLRERLTSIRPPQPLTKDGKPLLYGEPVRGPSDSALERAKGKPSDGLDEGLLRATWDSGPRGIDKWGKGRLATGRKVVQSGQGEPIPRELKAESPAEAPSVTPGAPGKIRLRLSTGGDGSTSPAPPTPSGTIKLKLGKRPSTDGNVTPDAQSKGTAESPAVKQE